MLVGEPPFWDDDNKKLFKQILDNKFVIKEGISDAAKNLIKSLLDVNPKTRLGSGKDQSEEIKNHEFFKGVNWENVMS